jgi:hypothetical protein
MMKKYGSMYVNKCVLNDEQGKRGAVIIKH